MKKQEWITLVAGLLCVLVPIGYLKLKNIDWSKVRLDIPTPTFSKEKKTGENVADAKPERLKGFIISATAKGLLVNSSYPYSSADSMSSVGGGGNVYIPPDPDGEGRPELVEGLFWVISHPKQKSKVDRDGIDVDAVPDGIFEYTTAFGASKRVKKYRVVKTFN